MGRRISMKRSDFLKVMGAGTLAALAGSALSACKSSSTTPTPTTDSHTFTSTTVQSHNHTITIQKTEVDTPPAGGISRETSSAGHTHTFTMSAADLTTVQGGTPVTIETASANGASGPHTHSFAISKWY
jgi:hypothetical protein